MRFVSEPTRTHSSFVDYAIAGSGISTLLVGTGSRRSSTMCRFHGTATKFSCALLDRDFPCFFRPAVSWSIPSVRSALTCGWPTPTSLGLQKCGDAGDYTGETSSSSSPNGTWVDPHLGCHIRYTAFTALLPIRRVKFAAHCSLLVPL